MLSTIAGKDALAAAPHASFVNRSAMRCTMTTNDRPANEAEPRASNLRPDGALAPAESAEWLRVTLSSIGDGVITTDRRGCVTFLNPVAQSLTGWTQEQAA